MQQPQNMYPQQLYYSKFYFIKLLRNIFSFPCLAHSVPQSFSMPQQTPSTQIPNQQPIPQSQYPAANTQAQTQSSQVAQQSSVKII